MSNMGQSYKARGAHRNYSTQMYTEHRVRMVYVTVSAEHMM